MINNTFIYLFLILSQVFSNSSWYFQKDDLWNNSVSSRSSALGGVYLEKFEQFEDMENLKNLEIESDKIKVFSSRVYGNSIKYSNIFYTKKVGGLIIFGNKINFIRFGFLNRRINDIANTTEIWSDELSPPITPDDLNGNSIDYYNHNDFSASVFIPIVNDIGQFSLNLKSGFSKIGPASSKSLNVDLSFLYSLNNSFHIGVSINNLFSFKKWYNEIEERFYPYLSVLMNYNYQKSNIFLEIRDFYLDLNYIQDKYRLSDNIGIGLEYLIYKDLYFRGGYSNYQASLGLGINLYDMVFDYSYLNHDYLGKTAQISATFLVGK